MSKRPWNDRPATPRGNGAHKRKAGPAFVYFLQAGDGGPVKIGWARDPHKRQKELQTGNPEQLNLIYFEDLDDWRHACEVESDLHREFAGYRIRGEWFELAGGLRHVLHELEAGVSVTEFAQYSRMRYAQEQLEEGAN